MADELLDSFVRVTWDPDGDAVILVDFGTAMWDPVKIDGKQLVDTVPGLNRAGTQNFPRANESHRLTFTLGQLTAGLEAAFEARLEAAIAAPRNMADVLLSLESGRSFRLKDCSVESWPSNQRGRITQETLVILGGELADSEDIDPPVVADLSLHAESELRNGGALAAPMEGAATWQSTTGSYQAAQGTAASRPTVARPTSSDGSGAGIGAPAGGLYLPGTAGNFGSAPSTVGELSPTGYFSLIWDGILPSYTPATKTCLISKWTAAGDLRSYAMFVNTNGTIELQISTDGTAAGVFTYTSTVPTALPDGRFVGIVAQKSTTGSVNFWLLSEGLVGFNNGVAPLLLGGSTNHGVLDPFGTSTPNLNIGATDAGTLNLMTGWTRTAVVFPGQFNTATEITSGYYVEFNAHVSGTTSLPTKFGGGQPNLTVNRSGSLPARVIKGHRATFDGTNDFMDLGIPLSVNAVSGVSIVWRGILNRVSGTNDLVFLGTADGAQPRALLRVNGGALQVLVRRLDAEATATIAHASGLTQYGARTLAVSINYASGLAALYIDGSLATTGALTSSGTSEGINSGLSRIMAGAAGANPAAGDVFRISAYQRALDIFEMADIHNALALAEFSQG